MVKTIGQNLEGKTIMRKKIDLAKDFLVDAAMGGIALYATTVAGTDVIAKSIAEQNTLDIYLGSAGALVFGSLAAYCGIEAAKRLDNLIKYDKKEGKKC